ncbi:hypothetical protein ACLOJK_024628 [Asimina triloba]
MSRALSISPSISSHCDCGRNRKPSSPLIRIAFSFGAARHLRSTEKTAFLVSAVGSEAAAAAASSAWSSEEKDDPVSIALQPISSEAQFDRIVAEAQQLEESFVVVWSVPSFLLLLVFVSWIRVRIRFYSVDVNTVPQRLVTRAGILGTKNILYMYMSDESTVEYSPRFARMKTEIFECDPKLYDKMPTIQLWKDGMKQAEVIGVHKAWLVVNDVREMIENES